MDFLKSEGSDPSKMYFCQLLTDTDGLKIKHSGWQRAAGSCPARADMEDSGRTNRAPLARRDKTRHHTDKQKDRRRKVLTRGGRWTWREGAGSPSNSLPTHAWQKTERKKYFVLIQSEVNQRKIYYNSTKYKTVCSTICVIIWWNLALKKKTPTVLGYF